MFKNIFNVFSRRQQPKKANLTPLTAEFRNRVLMLLRDSLGGNINYFFQELHKRLSYLHGKPQLSDENISVGATEEDVLGFLLTCSDPHFLDAIEYFFQIENGRYFHGNEEQFINQINEFLEIDNLPYYLTKSVWEEVETSFYGNPTTANQLREHPKVICRESDVLHETAIEPSLALLRKPDLLNANTEFMEALEDYRKRRYKDCITKCNSSIESVMKVICSKNNYSFTSNDTSGKLLKLILTNSSLDNFWEQPLILVSTIRNRLSSSHGAGLENKDVPPHIAKFTINATAAIILFLHDEAYN